jgi:hypothetical protein
VWDFTSRCEAGPCDARVVSFIPNRKGEIDKTQFREKALRVGGDYRWLRRLPRSYYCEIGGVRNYVEVNLEYSISPTHLAYVDGRWVVSRFDGTRRHRTGSTGGCPPGTFDESSAIRGKLERAESARTARSRRRTSARAFLRSSSIGEATSFLTSSGATESWSASSG